LIYCGKIYFFTNLRTFDEIALEGKEVKGQLASGRPHEVTGLDAHAVVMLGPRLLPGLLLLRPCLQDLVSIDVVFFTRSENLKCNKTFF